MIGDIEREQPDVVGISIPSMAQMVPGLTLAALIKERGLPCHVMVGGPHITMLRERIKASPGLFELIDSAIVFDGEVPLLRAVRGAGRRRRSVRSAEPDLSRRRCDPGDGAQKA